MTATVSRIVPAKHRENFVMAHGAFERQHQTARSENHPTAAVQQYRATNPKWVARAKTEAKTFFGCMAIGAVVGFLFGFIAAAMKS